jgi:hypothetical protein
MYRVFHFKCNHNNIICVVLRHQYNKANELFLFLFGRSYITALQKMVKMSTTFAKRSIHPPLACFVRLCEVSLLATVCSTLCFTSSKLCGLFENERMFCSWTLEHAQLLRNWHQQRPSNKGDFAPSVNGEVVRLSIKRWRTCFWFNILPQYVTAGLRFKRYNLYWYK